MNLKVGVLVALAAALLFVIVPHSTSGRSYHASVKEYDCNVSIADDPRAVMANVLAAVDISCAAPPRTTSLTVTLQYRPKDSVPWQQAGPTKEFIGTPTTQKSVMDVTQPCKAGFWRVGYLFGGTGAATGAPFTTLPAWSSSQSVTSSQCTNS